MFEWNEHDISVSVKVTKLSTSMTLKICGHKHREYSSSRSSRGQPAGRRVRQRPASARLRAPANRRAGHDGRAAVRHLAAAARLARLRLENPHQVLRNGLGQAGIHRGNQAQGKPNGDALTVASCLRTWQIL